MVVVNEIKNSLWGMKLEAGQDKQFELKSDKPILIAMAALDTSVPSDEFVPVLIKSPDTENMVLCTLGKTSVLQQKLELGFNTGESVTFSLKSKTGAVYLTGFYVNEPEMPDHDHDDDDEEIDEKDNKKLNDLKNGIKRKLDEEKPDKNAKKGKNDDKAPKLVPNEPAANKKKTQEPQVKTIGGGVQIKDLQEGTGPVAKKGKMISVYYVGKLKQNGKQFDACKSGKPFKFRLGAGDVIKGWDIGFENMKVGGKRVITVPPNMGYGNKSLGGIPSNSTLVFEVELKGVN